jgi:release factor glutamine methyltransferase
MNNEFKCTKHTFIPRKDTEILIHQALRYIQQHHNNQIIVFDIGTGSGNLAITLALHQTNIHVYASDISKEALAISKENIDYYHLHNQITLLQGDLFTPHHRSLQEMKADLIICNPPYIPTSKLKQMPAEIIDYEPAYAFDGGPFGLNIFTQLIKHAPRFLKPNGMLLFEFGKGQHHIIKRFFNRSNKYRNVTFHKYQNVKRAVSAIYTPIPIE